MRQNAGERETYAAGYGEEFIRHLEQRHATKQAAFLLPHLQPGMSLLDCGCGPGTITMGLAQAVNPGPLVGVDLEPSQIALCEKRAREGGVTNATFRVADLYALPFDDGAYDVVFCHCVLQHLKDPLKALSEMHRVLKKGGLIAVRDEDRKGAIIAPDTADGKAEDLMDLLNRFQKHCGGDPFIGRRLRELVRRAGFHRNEATASCECQGNPGAIRGMAASAGSLQKNPRFLETVVAMGWTTREKLERTFGDVAAWGEHPDAFHCSTLIEVIAWK